MLPVRLPASLILSNIRLKDLKSHVFVLGSLGSTHVKSCSGL